MKDALEAATGAIAPNQWHTHPEDLALAALTAAGVPELRVALLVLDEIVSGYPYDSEGEFQSLLKEGRAAIANYEGLWE